MRPVFPDAGRLASADRPSDVKTAGRSGLIPVSQPAGWPASRTTRRARRLLAGLTAAVSTQPQGLLRRVEPGTIDIVANNNGRAGDMSESAAAGRIKKPDRPRLGVFIRDGGVPPVVLDGFLRFGVADVFSHGL